MHVYLLNNVYGYMEMVKFLFINLLGLFLFHGFIFSSLPASKFGILDLRNWDFQKYGAISLNGEWEFYWMQLLEPDDFSNTLHKNLNLVSYFNVPTHGTIIQ